MNFSSLQYYLFLPFSVIGYYLVKPKWRNTFLLILSYFFYLCWRPAYALLILTSTVITYCCSLLMEKKLWGKKKLYLVLSLCINLAILFFYKYFNFFAGLIYDLFTFIGIPAAPLYLNVLLPVGISFYTFQALGYTMDVYRGHIKAEKNFINYALFVSFFPQLVAGPIERSTNLFPQLNRVSKFSFANIKMGLVPIFWGLFKKLVIADRLALIVNTVYPPVMAESEFAYRGIHYLIATVCFAFQIYCDFSAYSDIARGSAKMFHIDLMINFKAPYFASSVKDFWRRWHISLSTWFKDYLYFPLGGSRCSLTRNCINLLIVFAVSGLWHGAALTFVIWGLLNGLYQVVGQLLTPLKRKIPFQIPFSALLKTVITFMLICFSWIFFRAETIQDALFIIKEIFLIPKTGIFPLGLSSLGIERAYLAVAFIAVSILLLYDFISQYKDIEAFINRRTFTQYLFYFIIIVACIIFGYYGSGYDPQDFIYFQF